MAVGFVDKATISVRAGRGGDGAVAFHREKYIAAGGPDGGDGGRGGDVIVKVDDNMSTLMDFRYKRKYAAENGVNGQGARCSGRDGADIVIRVPRGTLIRDKETGGIIRDMSGSESFVLARGGRGGWGNKHFATPTRQTPRFAKPGREGESREVVLELKLLADVGLVGFPNVGKSTLLSVVSKAHPKIADYHFTTLFPNLGVVYVTEGVSFVMADIPGIIEGAAQGAGLGHDFLRHIDRCRLLIHMVDVSGSEGRDPIEDFEAINKELSEYNELLASRPQIVVGTKTDLVPEGSELIEEFRDYVVAQGYEFFPISSVTHTGTLELIRAVAGKLATLPPVVVYEPDYVVPEPELIKAGDVEIEFEDGVWFVEGAWLERLVATVNFSDYESRMYFDRNLREAGVFERMEALGVKDGDTVSIEGLEFDYKS
jgi:GTP-binding protein